MLSCCVWPNSPVRCQSTWCNPPGTQEPGAKSENSTRCPRTSNLYSTTPYCGTPGPPWEDFEERIIHVAATRVDDRGWSLADHLLAVDEGSPGVPMPISNAADLRKAQMGRRKRQKESYALLATHQADKTIVGILQRDHFPRWEWRSYDARACACDSACELSTMSSLSPNERTAGGCYLVSYGLTARVENMEFRKY